MNASRIIVLVLFVALLAAPFLFQDDTGSQASSKSDIDAIPLIILTPHNEQIRGEFKRAFEAWHLEKFNQPVDVIWSVPGGTSDIRKMLEAQFEGALRDGRPLGGAADIMFGGGQYEHSELAKNISVTVDGELRETTISQPIDFDQTWLDDMYGTNKLANAELYDPDKHWFGTAISSFGIIYNNHALDEVGVQQPTYWQDLAHPELLGWVALGNPNQSGSIRKSFETILQQRGWVEGWQILRRVAANARYFSASSSKVPIDVSQGDAAAGVCIDFYGRFQVQVVSDSGDDDRLGYVDPPGETSVDADPISLIRGAPQPEIARRFVEFTLTEEAQALWQFRRKTESNHDLGPVEFELRRMPIRRVMYEKYLDHFIDQANPFETARAIEAIDPNYWSYVSLIFTAMVIDNHDELAEAWQGIITHPAYPDAGDIVSADDVDDATLKDMLERFDAFPTVRDGSGMSYSLATDEHLSTIKAGWLKHGWAAAGLWPSAANPSDVLRVEFSQFFRERYESIIDLADK